MNSRELFRMTMLYGSLFMVTGMYFPNDLVWGFIILMMGMFLVTTYDKLKEDWQKYKEERNL